MIELTTLLAFVASSYLLIVTPGPAVFYILARTINQGKKAGIMSVLGILLGAFVHLSAAVLGLSAIIASSAMAYTLLKFLGAGYLIYMGIKTLMNKGNQQEISVQKKSSSAIFKEGFIVNILNPKVALFFMAFLPQFTNPDLGNISLQIIILGLVFIVIAAISDSIYILFASSLRQVLLKSAFFTRFQRYFSGLTYILLGITAVFSGSNDRK